MNRSFLRMSKRNKAYNSLLWSIELLLIFVNIAVFSIGGRSSNQEYNYGESLNDLETHDYNNKRDVNSEIIPAAVGSSKRKNSIKNYSRSQPVNYVPSRASKGGRRNANKGTGYKTYKRQKYKMQSIPVTPVLEPRKRKQYKNSSYRSYTRRKYERPKHGNKILNNDNKNLLKGQDHSLSYRKKRLSGGRIGRFGPQNAFIQTTERNLRLSYNRGMHNVKSQKINRTKTPAIKKIIDQSEMDTIPRGNGRKDLHSFFSENVPKSRQRNLKSNPSTTPTGTKENEIL